jgi:hypothetical protein
MTIITEMAIHLLLTFQAVAVLLMEVVLPVHGIQGLLHLTADQATIQAQAHLTISFPHPNEREDMTLQEAKDQIAKRHGSESWHDFNIWNRGNELGDEAAELYARSKWDEACTAQLLKVNLDPNCETCKPEFKP